MTTYDHHPLTSSLGHQNHQTHQIHQIHQILDSQKWVFSKHAFILLQSLVWMTPSFQLVGSLVYINTIPSPPKNICNNDKSRLIFSVFQKRSRYSNLAF